MTASTGRRSRDRAVACGIFFLALAVYLLTYSGGFKSNDERALFAGADSWVKRGAFTIDQIYWDYTHVGMLTGSGEMVPNYEPAQMVLAVPLYLWGRALGAAAQGVMFFAALVSAASAALVYLCLAALGYATPVSAVAALVFAFATQTWPYSKSFFREPLTTLAYLLAFYALLRHSRHRIAWPAIAGAALGLAVTNKQTSVAIAPALLVLAAGDAWRGLPECTRASVSAAWRGPASWAGRLRRVLAAAAAAWRDVSPARRWLAPVVAFLLPLALILALYRVYYAATLSDVSSFARNVGEYTTNPQLSTSKLGQMVYAFLGITISPYKGLLWYSPVLLLGLVGAWPFVRRHPWEGIACLLAIAAHLLGYSRYLYWSGGVAWGSRYMLVLAPFFILLSAPVFAWLLRDRAADRLTGAVPGPNSGQGDGLPMETAVPAGSSRPRSLAALGRALVVLLVLVSVAVQVLGVSIDVRAYETPFLLEQAKVWGGVGEAIQALYMSPAYSPVAGHLKLLLGGRQPLDFAWIPLRPDGRWAFLPAGLALSLAGVALAIVALAWLWRRPRRAGYAATGLGVLYAGLATALLLTYRQGDARFDPYGVDRFLRPMDRALQEAVASGQAPCCRLGQAGDAACAGALVVPDPVLTDYYLNYFSAALPWYGVDARPAPAELLDRLAQRYTQIWLARDRDAASDDAEGRRDAERYLAEHAYKVDEQRFGDWARLLRYSAAGALAESAQPAAALGDMSLDRVTLRVAPGGLPASCSGAAPDPAAAAGPSDDGKVPARSGDTLQIGLNWRAQAAPEANYTVFVQLLDAGSQVKAQSDRWPGDGLFPTAALSAGQVITDNLALRLDVPPGAYRLIAGLYRNDRPGLPRLAGPSGDHVLLAEVDVR